MTEAPKLYTASEAMAEQLRKQYPGVEVVITQPLPTNQEQQDA